jgi:hypothetical protein
MTDYTTIQINDNTRIVVQYDQSPSNPRKDETMLTGALTVNGDSRLIDVEPVYEFPGNLRYAYDQMGAYDFSRNWSDPVIRWAKVFYDIHVEMIDGTYWWVDPDQLVENFYSMASREYEYDGQPIDKVELEKKIIAGEHAHYRNWGDGNVYGVIIETRQSYARVEQDSEGLWELANPLTEDDVHDEWEQDESCWGFYLDTSPDAPDEDTQFRQFAQDLTDIDLGDSHTTVTPDSKEKNK